MLSLKVGGGRKSAGGARRVCCNRPARALGTKFEFEPSSSGDRYYCGNCGKPVTSYVESEFNQLKTCGKLVEKLWAFSTR
ncbi:MAG: hypothetical protein PUP90_25175 [Nostoc sp. S4]|nr:hypothetical protein [Nostoc sp. S4]